ncbi:hypothetical protein HPB49_009157 [Dermacentor silvarum]|uniref:Uncharacterized protein n=1 Tax=Dermacentor silvarum TaxID=543639 RepID=A0ACB8D4B9_DERSI|nr:hypothetical protein HPB49_009157 [Dermacentor silvarum]
MQGPDMRGDGDTGQTTPHRGSTRGILPPVPGAPVKKRNRCQSAKGSLTPKRLVYNGVSQTQEGTQDTSECLDPDSSQEMQELLETRINTVEGTWVQCDNLECNKWRYLANVIDPSELPEKWFCSMNSDPKHNTCEAEEDDLPDDDLLETKYFVGSLVWAKVNTYPWWPAMIDDDPDLGVYEWRESEHGLPVPGYYRKMFDTAVATAEIALKMTVATPVIYRGMQSMTSRNVLSALELEREDMEPGDCKKASAALAAPTTRILKQPARGKLSAIQSKRRIEETIQAQTYEKGSKENVSIVTASLIPTVTTASGKTKVVAHDAGVTVSKRHAEHETQNEEAGAPSEQSLFTSSTDHKNPDSMGATAFPQPIKNPGCAFKMSAVPNPAEKKDDSAVCAGVTIDSVTESDRVKLRTDIDVTHAPIDNATAQAEPDSDKSPTRTKADDAKLLVPRRDSTEAEFVYSIPSFDSAEAQLDAMMSIL